MQKVSVQSIQLEQTPKDAILQALKDLDPSVYEGLDLFRGVALSSSVNSHSLRFNSKAMGQVKDAFNQQLGVFTDHITRATNRVGKTLTSHVRDGNLHVHFGIQPGIEVAHSDDLIRIMSSLGSELSITFYPEDDGITCEKCGIPMMPSWYGYIWKCENDHYLGETYKTPDGIERIVGIVENIDRVCELSVVGNGSDPDTEVVQQILNETDISVNLMATMAEMNNLDLKQLSHQLSLESVRLQGSEPRRRPSPPSTIKGDESMSEPTANPLETSIQDLTAQITAKSLECEELKTKIENLKTEEEYQNLATTTANLRLEIEKKDQRIAELEALETSVSSEIKHWYTLACDAKKKQMNYKDDDPRYVSYCEEMKGIKNLRTLRLQVAANSAAYESERLEMPTLILNDGDGPRVGSGATN